MYRSNHGTFRKVIAVILSAAILTAFCSCSANTGSTGVSGASGTASGKPVIGIAWTSDPGNELFTNTCRAIETAGGTWKMLEQVKTHDLLYDQQDKLTDGVDECGALDEGAGKVIRCNYWTGSNAGIVLEGVSAVVFTGGEDISPSLYYDQQYWHEIEEEKDYNAERDVSDYLTMSYCLDHNIPLLGLGRGMQMLAVVSGSDMIQDIPTFFEDAGSDYNFEHRNRISSPDTYRDYASHEITISKGTKIYNIVKTEILSGCPSWHHQAVWSTGNTRLIISAYTPTGGFNIIEAVERTDVTFAVGIQFHPEAAVVKSLDKAANSGDYMDYDTALSFFEYFVSNVAGQ